MPPIVALSLTVAFIIFLYRRDAKETPRVSSALWIPLLWYLIAGSRFVSQWLSLGQGGGPSMEEGSPLDAAVFAGLIVAGYSILQKRGITLRNFSQENRWLMFFLIYCLLAILWSDFPFVAFKRWIKILGHPIMALIVLTDPNPVAAFRKLFKRAAFVLVPMSILFIKYYPQYGRGFDNWTGLAFNQGVNLNKNELGYCCMISGLFFFWNLLQAFKLKNRKARRNEVILSLAFFAMVLWLLKLSSSATSLSCMVVGAATILVLGLPFVSKRHVGFYVIIGILVFALSEPIFGIYGEVLKVLGRDPTLTDRTQVWHDALTLQPNPLLGAGFESFWLGSRLAKLWAKWWWHPNQAHNGYIETYLNLGLVGVAILAGVLLDTFRKISKRLVKDFEFSRLRLAFLFAIMMYNFTEATFKGTSLVW
ncbi:MAG: O-antigen ligase family protein, partial [Verrucomicrobia bacterium]|nr:O-antigen ligase family protein [Verrucomicrobiota bacterium]